MTQEQQVGRWAKLCEEAKAKQAVAPKPAPDYYYYVGKNIKHLSPKELVCVSFTIGKRPCWLVRALQALVGIHWAEEGKIFEQIRTNKK